MSAAAIAEWSAALATLALPPEDERHAGPDELQVALAVLQGAHGRARRLAAALAARAEGRWPDIRSGACRALAVVRTDELDLDGARGWAQAAVAVAARPEVRALALLAAGEAELLHGDTESASARLQEALAHAAGFGQVECRVLFAVSRVTVALDQRAEARALVQRAAATVERTGREADAWALREVLGRLAASRGEHDVADSHLQAAIDRWRAAGQHEAANRVMVPSVGVALDRGDEPRARAAVRAAASSALVIVRVGAAAGGVAVGAVTSDAESVDRGLLELGSALGSRRLLLPDVAALLRRAVAAGTLDAERCRRAEALAAQVSGRAG